MSTKHSVALTDVTILSQEPLVPLRFNDEMERLRVISLQDVSGSCLLFLTNNFREAELLVCGLKLLLERETARLGVRGGLPLTAFGGRHLEGAMSPSAARGFRDATASTGQALQTRSRGGYRRSTSELLSLPPVEPDDSELDQSRRRTWGSVPGRDYMRGLAAALVETDDHVANEQGVPHFVHGQQILRVIAKKVRLPLPLPLCRVLLLDATSPVIKTWERDRGDKNFEKTAWAFPPASLRELERHSSEHQLIASGSMCGAHRMTSFDRPRYGSMIRLSETHTVEADDSKKVSLTVTEGNPRRGFSVKVRISLHAFEPNACEANAVAEVRPIGKNMSNQASVHRAFLLLMDENRIRYGTEEHGLLAGFLHVVDEMANGGSATGTRRTAKPVLGNNSRGVLSKPFRRTDPSFEEKKSDPMPPPSGKSNVSNRAESGLVSLEDMLKTGRESPETVATGRPVTPSILHQIPEANPSKRLASRKASLLELDDVAQDEKKDPVLIEVKPLPKIRLSLLPSPREEDEEEGSTGSRVLSKAIRKKKGSRSSRNSSSSRKTSRSSRKTSI
jgi:hypothetical protein